MRAGGGAATSAGPAWGGDGPVRGFRPGGQAGRRRRLWTRAGPFPWIAPAAAGASPPPLLGSPARAGKGAALCPSGLGAVPPSLRRRGPRRGVPGRTAPRLGRRLAADLELVRTRGIRLFN